MLPQRPPIVILAPHLEQDAVESNVVERNVSERNTSGQLAIATEISVARHSTQLGWILLKNRMVLPSQLGAALTAQMLYQKKLGEVLMERQLISEDQLRDALREQLLRRRGHWVI